MRLFLVSGNGSGAGKTALAKRLAPMVMSLGDFVRIELQRQYPDYDWYNRSQTYKDITKVKGTGLTVRELLIRQGQMQCVNDPIHYARLLAEKIKLTDKALMTQTIVSVDDLRKQVELEYLRQTFPGTILHLHVLNPSALPEPQYDGSWLHENADYVVRW